MKMGDGPSDLARRTFAKSMGGDEGGDDGEDKPGKSMPDAGAVAGKRFKAALDGGDGKTIYEAFKALKEECDGDSEESSEPNYGADEE